MVNPRLVEESISMCLNCKHTEGNHRYRLDANEKRIRRTEEDYQWGPCKICHCYPFDKAISYKSDSGVYYRVPKVSKAYLLKESEFIKKSKICAYSDY